MSGQPSSQSPALKVPSIPSNASRTGQSTRVPPGAPRSPYSCTLLSMAQRKRMGEEACMPWREQASTLPGFPFAWMDTRHNPLQTSVGFNAECCTGYNIENFKLL